VVAASFFCGALALCKGSAPPHLRSGFGQQWPTRAAAVAAGGGEAETAAALRADLLRLLPEAASGAPATNVSLPQDRQDQIREAASRLEPRSEYRDTPIAESPEALAALDGSWQLLYSDASEITRLARLPLGFRLGPVFQPLDTARGRLENQAFVRHSLGLASGHTRVLARFEPAERGMVDRAGVVNDRGNRVKVKFERVVFTLVRLLFIPLFGLIRKVAVPKGPAEQKGVTPTLDITYLDDTLRISRGGDGSLFVLQRPLPGGRQPMPMLEDTDLRVTDEKTFNAATDVLPSGARGGGDSGGQS